VRETLTGQKPARPCVFFALQLLQLT